MQNDNIFKRNNIHLEFYLNVYCFFYFSRVEYYLDRYLNERGIVMGFQESIKAMSDKTRREILNLLKDGDMTAGDIAAHFSMTQATVSHHLSVLKDGGLVTDRRDGKYIFYELNTSVIEEIMAWLIELKGVDKNER